MAKIKPTIGTKYFKSAISISTNISLIIVTNNTAIIKSNRNPKALDLGLLTMKTLKHSHNKITKITGITAASIIANIALESKITSPFLLLVAKVGRL